MSLTLKEQIAMLPTEFRAVSWNDGWEFDMPCVVYFPAKYAHFEIVGGTGVAELVVDAICMNIVLGHKPNDGGLARECEWRGWSINRMGRRKAAWHATIKVRWFIEDGELAWAFTSSKETYGARP
jgi:hypothetical protein